MCVNVRPVMDLLFVAVPLSDVLVGEEYEW